MPKVTVIPASVNPFNHMPSHTVQKRRVAGYARVSTDSDEQFTSYEAQVDYYTEYIKKRNDWEFVAVYTDEGISGCSTKHRAGFREMIADALNGKIDLIVTKSVSRFARNTVDSLVTIRQLKENGVEVYFEKENIFTFDGKGELLLTIMSSLAQEESRSISENVTWGQRKRFADGKVNLPYKHFLGYDRGEGWRPSHQRSGGRGCPAHLQTLFRGQDTGNDLQTAARDANPHAERKNGVEQDDGDEHPAKREIQR